MVQISIKDRPLSYFNRVSTLLFIWLYGIGLSCIALPYIWWPVQMGPIQFLHIIMFAALLFFVVRSQGKGGIFDHERAKWRGFVGVAAYSFVFLSSAFVYRWLLL